nr:MAG TPA: hypothetical protein [Caudoviricetes sp.]DAQ62709.1 MAG TPA: hypothetical protein [Caudoviricetes sp.]
MSLNILTTILVPEACRYIYTSKLRITVCYYSSYISKFRIAKNYHFIHSSYLPFLVLPFVLAEKPLRLTACRVATTISAMLGVCY